MKGMIEAIYYRSPVFLQNLLVSAYGYKLYHKRYSGPLYSEIMEKVRLSRSWNSEEIEAYQSERLHEVVKHCRLNIPYYQQQFAEHGIHENDITSTEHITRLPILEKQKLKEHSQLFTESSTKPFMLQHTSGSTGTPLTLMVNEETYKLAMALLVDHEETHGVPFGAKRATFAGRMVQPATDMTPPFARMNRAENQKLFSSYHLNSQTFPWYRAELDRFQPAELIGYPSAICDLATQYREAGVSPAFRPAAIVTNSETLLEWQRAIIEDVFGCMVSDYYGTAEYVLFAGQDKNGIYRLNPLIGITELLAQPGDSEAKRLIATTLTNTKMPLLRYDLGDTAESQSEHHSGNVVHQLKTINGRVDDYIETPDGRKIGRIDHIFKGLDGISEAQVIQNAPDHCIIKIIVQSALSEMDREALKTNFSARTGGAFRHTVETVSSIPRGPNGKFKSVIRNISPD
ncbi:phenylacetate--CoA ligase family protein [Marinobacter sp. 1-3A]|uniref:phenylacetate--CoA ligase family protein n=1 Tax=Marinobacter sp. 1-3A TaxID=2582920 RepID=UPI001903F7CC|nr:phenylacetate--CoA ligase family protein [Marinobacter sp. 1-3A]MBK1871740.1 phenylacetate--CoA ligase family protein [Marinobacter sp. 1-3A]